MATNLPVLFPVGGLDRSVAFQDQRPFFTPACMNVQPDDVLDERARGGSRPGLQRTHITLGEPIRMLAEVAIARVEGDARTQAMNPFDGDGFGATRWSAILDGFPSMTSGTPEVGASDGTRGALLVAQSQRTDLLAVAEVYIAPFAGTYAGQTHGLVVSAQDTTTFEHFQLTLNAATFTLARNGTDIASGAMPALAGWFRLEYTGANWKAVFCGRELATGTDLSTAGTQVGFSLSSAADTVAQALAFRFDYHSRDPGTGFRNELVCSADGDLYHETFPGIWEQVITTMTLGNNARIRSAAQLQKLWIADYQRVAGNEFGTVAGTLLSAVDETTTPIDFTTLGLTTDMLVILSNGVGVTQGIYTIASVAAGGITLGSAPGDGTTSWRVVHSPKIYDPIDDTLTAWIATTGQYPAGCTLVCRYRDRIVLAGDPVSPHLWYMSRQGDALDFDYGQPDTDVQRAVAGQASDAGVIGDAITALVPHSDDYLIVGCSSSLWVIRGDPAYGGQIDALSRTVGIVGPDAWAAAPDGSTWFVAPDGVYVVPPGAQGMPQPVSRDRLPQEFRLLGDRDVQCSWDHESDGLRIFIADPNEVAGTHWLVRKGGFWPVKLPYAFEPTALLSLPPRPLYDGPLLLGSRDGAVRRFERSAPTDDGTLFTSSVTFGPLRMTSDEGTVGMLSELRVVLDKRVGPVDVEVQVGNRAQDAQPFADYEVNADAVRTFRPRARAHSARVEISSDQPWAFESMVVGVRRKGARRP